VEITETVNDAFDPFRFHQMSRAPKVRVRGKFVLAAIALFSVISLVLALYTEFQMHALATQVQQDQSTNIAVLQDYEHRLAVDERSIRLMNDTILK
jgi:predicted unusual protein kinase regulating ubiquinone biosynthesis (AarF/ABC1/UbiB family)